MRRFVNLSGAEWDQLGVEDGDRRALEIEKAKKFVDSLKKLCTARQWQIVRLYYWEGLTQQQVAGALGIGRQVVGRQLAAVRRRARALRGGC